MDLSAQLNFKTDLKPFKLKTTVLLSLKSAFLEVIKMLIDWIWEAECPVLRLASDRALVGILLDCVSCSKG